MRYMAILASLQCRGKQGRVFVSGALSGLGREG